MNDYLIIGYGLNKQRNWLYIQAENIDKALDIVGQNLLEIDYVFMGDENLIPQRITVNSDGTRTY